MKDIAELADVSVTTVSRVLRGERLDRFSQETRDRIEEAARTLGWRPNLLVRGIQTGRTSTIGVIVPPFDTFWMRVLYGIHDRLLEDDQVPMVLWPKEEIPEEPARPAAPGEISGDGEGVSPREELLRLQRLMDRRVDGIISWPLFEPDALAFLAQAGAYGLPIVTIDHELPPEARSLTIEVDEAAAMRLVIDHLVSLGHRRIAFVGHTGRQSWRETRRRSFEEAAGGVAGVSLALEEKRNDVAEASRWAFEADPALTALVAATDHIAMQAIAGLRTMGLEAPGDVSVVGYGDIEFEGWGGPPLTTINKHPLRTGRRAAEEVVRSEAFTRARRISMSPELIVRSSTGPAAARAR